MPVVSTPYPPGTPCWVDLMAPDLQAAIDFYRDLFGWQGERGPDEFGGYAVLTLNGKPVAGIGPAVSMDGNPPPPTVWTTYLATADADATASRVTANGGKLLFPVMDVGTVGRMFPAVDPTGAVFGVWQAVDFGGAEIVNEPGAVIWNELNTPDVKGAAAFYKAALDIEFAPMPEMPEYNGLLVEGKTVGGAQGLGSFPPGTPPHWATYFAVDDADSVVDAAVRAGATLLAPATDTPVGRIAGLKDPQGGAFNVIKPQPFEAG
ncbi:VOC family protein [Kitasatospora sp. NBC_01250]|uniref:VOC family protein n=1 Tax=unclassified Kitasatospora TaxID=2633591 RepID=UPI002E150A79|nr:MULTISPECIES: VOC family protein [unclassified Kitasatospora]WSJ69744.1 VOC family protein [Kitasatospora sp. NBC_01302]